MGGLEGLPLTHLGLTGREKVLEDRDLQKLALKLPNLTSLDLGLCLELTSSGIGQLQKLPLSRMCLYGRWKYSNTIKVFLEPLYWGWQGWEDPIRVAVSPDYTPLVVS